MVEVRIVYEGQLRCLATHGPSGTTLSTDAPLDNQGRAESFSPTDLVAVALGSCMLTIMGIIARRHEWDLGGTAVRVEKHMITAPVRRIGRLPVEITVPIKLTLDQRQMIERAVLTCPVHQSLHPDIDAPVTFHWAS